MAENRITEVGVQVIYTWHPVVVTDFGVQVLVDRASIQTAQVTDFGVQVLVSGWTASAIVGDFGVNVLVEGIPPDPRPRSVVVTAG